MQETQFELWVPVNHANQLQHWTAATDALDHVILTAAALESVLEGMACCRAKGRPGGGRACWVWAGSVDPHCSCPGVCGGMLQLDIGAQEGGGLGLFILCLYSK